MSAPIFVTQPSLPPLEELHPYLEKIWDSRILTNGGPLHNQLESALAEFLSVEYVSLCNNGTNALITATQALSLSGEVITTPYSFVATTHALMWNGLTPVFVDIDPETLNIDPSKIEAAITDKTTAIMAVHCYGYPCDTAAIEAVARKHKLKVIYDAAHAFGVRHPDGRSLLNDGDLSVLSFHATKVFNTFEGGAIICRDKDLRDRINRLRNFGIQDEVTVTDCGSNAKMSEFNAAMGLAQIGHIGSFIEKRRDASLLYQSLLSGIPGVECLNARVPAEHHNFSYFPILLSGGQDRDAIHEGMKKANIFTRRYFYPLISDFPVYRDMPGASPKNLPVAGKAAAQVLCLPLYDRISTQDIRHVTDTIKSML